MMCQSQHLLMKLLTEYAYKVLNDYHPCHTGLNNLYKCPLSIMPHFCSFADLKTLYSFIQHFTTSSSKTEHPIKLQLYMWSGWGRLDDVAYPLSDGLSDSSSHQDLSATGLVGGGDLCSPPVFTCSSTLIS